MDMLTNLFGGGRDDDDHTANARDYISRFEQGAPDQGYSDEEAMRHYQNVARHADPATMQRAAEQTFSRMDPAHLSRMSQLLQHQAGGQAQGAMSADPRQMAGMVAQLHQQDTGGLTSLLGGGGTSGGGLGGMLGGLTGGGSGGGLGGLLGGGGGGFPGGTLGKVALGGIAAYAMKEIIGNHSGSGSGNPKRSV